MDHRTSVIFSACVAVFYTLFGGLYSVAYTDVIQLFCIFLGLWMCIPFAWANPHVKPLSSMEVDWIGSIDSNYYWFYADYGLLLIFGGIPWQVRAFDLEYFAIFFIIHDSSKLNNHVLKSERCSFPTIGISSI